MKYQYKLCYSLSTDYRLIRLVFIQLWFWRLMRVSDDSSHLYWTSIYHKANTRIFNHSFDSWVGWSNSSFSAYYTNWHGFKPITFETHKTVYFTIPLTAELAGAIKTLALVHTLKTGRGSNPWPLNHGTGYICITIHWQLC